MISKEQISSKAKDVVVYLLMGLSEFRDEFVLAFSDYKDNTRIASPLSLLSLVNNSKEKEQKDVEVTKTFEPSTHIYKRMLKFPEDRNLYLEYINSVPNGYGVLEPVDGSGYSIDDIGSYEGLITLVFYNETYVDVKGKLDIDTGEYLFNNPGVTSTFCYGSSHSVQLR